MQTSFQRLSSSLTNQSEYIVSSFRAEESEIFVEVVQNEFDRERLGELRWE